jgi:hypothetical protein
LKINSGAVPAVSCAAEVAAQELSGNTFVFTVMLGLSFSNLATNWSHAGPNVFVSLVNWFGPERVMVTFPPADGDGDEHPAKAAAVSAAAVATAKRRTRFFGNIFVVDSMLSSFLGVARELL